MMASSYEQPSFYVSVAGHTDVGRVREKNEDAFTVADLTGGNLLDGAPHARFNVGERGVLLAVSDGMGGAEALSASLSGRPRRMPQSFIIVSTCPRFSASFSRRALNCSYHSWASMMKSLPSAGRATTISAGTSKL
jgi:serine/threonine protein phosphatase PrpC